MSEQKDTPVKAPSKKRLHKLASLSKTLMGVGCVGFGGGSALIPIFQERIVQNEKILTEDELNDDIVIACVTPGALPVEISAGIGKQTNGSLGSLVGAASIALPGVALLVLIIAVLSQFGSDVITQVNYLAIGASAYIIGILATYIKTTVKKFEAPRMKAASIAIIVLVTLVSCEKSLYKLLGLTGSVPVIFNIGTVNVMALALFFIIWIRDKRTVARILPAVVIALFYIGCVGGLKLFKGSPVAMVLIAIMWIMTIYSLVTDASGKMDYLNAAKVKQLVKEVIVVVIVVAICSIPALICYDGTLFYLGNGALSSILSFGGGDAYIAMAEGMFVDTGMINDSDFYTQLVPVANALPGSILCKVLTGMGYFMGFRATGSLVAGLAVAFAGFVCAVGMSCLTFFVGYFFYEGLENLQSFNIIKKLISSIISGLLITVALGLLATTAQVSCGSMWIGAYSAIMCIVFSIVNFALINKIGAKPLPMVVGSAVLTCIICNCMCML